MGKEMVDREHREYLFPRIVVCTLVVLSSATVASGVLASVLLPMSTGAPDMSLNGTNIAEPISPSGALFANPAGLCGFDTTTLTASFGYGFGSMKINNADGYSEENHLWAAIPDFAVAFVGSGRWRYGVGTYGSIGTNYDFPADPDAGVPNDFHSETTIVALPLAVAYRWSDRVHLGAELIVLGAHLRNRYTLGTDEFRYTLRGPGVQPMLGATWKPHEDWSFGLGTRLPGYIWMDGSTVVPAGVRRDVDLTIEMPSEVSLGVTHRLTRRVTLFASGRWTDSSRLAESEIEFDGLSAANVPFIPDAEDEWRYAAAVQLQVAREWKLRFGFSRSNRIVGTEGTSPLVFDNSDTRVSAGVAFEQPDWTIDTMFGYSFHQGRDVDPDEALVIPGHYDSGGGIVMVGMTYRL